MNRYDRPKSLLQVLQQVDDLRLDGDVERRDRLVADDEVGLDGERAGDADALSLAAGELVRVALRMLGAAARPPRAARERARSARRACRCRAPASAPAGCRWIGHPRVQRRIRILENDLQVAPHPAHLVARQPGDVLPLEAHRTAARLEQPQDQRGRWSTCRSPTRPRAPSVSPRATSKLTSSTARTWPTVLLKITPRLTGKCLTQPLDAQDRFGAHAATLRLHGRLDAVLDRRLRSTPPGVPPPICPERRHLRMATRIRERAAWREAAARRAGWPDWARQPSMVARRSRSTSSRGIEPSRPMRVGVLRIVEQRTHGCLLDDLAGVHHDDVGRPARRPRPGRG